MSLSNILREGILVRTFTAEKISIRAACIEEWDSVFRFYYDLIEDMHDSGIPLGWEKNIVPSEKFIKKSILKQELHIGESAGQVAAAMVVNSECDEEYSSIKWQVRAEQQDVMVMHSLGVLGRYQGQGIASRMINHAYLTAMRTNKKAVRLDVLKNNIKARELYEAMGFKYIDENKMFYKDIGFIDFVFYELAL
ncbi:MAG: GNAT family N-acetyltransferase [Firmicutes bacterium]|nr:GNAT family N-acetyltransferase [Bacillota bacterium]